jgi:8-oxo-dGTP diphosphatase
MEGEVLLGRRKGAHGAGMWSLPGGRIEVGEDPKKTAEREVLEETGLYVDVSPAIVPYNNTMAGGEPWLTLFFTVWVENAEPKVMEPDKCEEWAWFPGYELPGPLFEPFEEFVKAVRAMRRR